MSELFLATLAKIVLRVSVCAPPFFFFLFFVRAFERRRRRRSAHLWPDVVATTERTYMDRCTPAVQNGKQAKMGAKEGKEMEEKQEDENMSRFTIFIFQNLFFSEMLSEKNSG